MPYGNVGACTLRATADVSDLKSLAKLADKQRSRATAIKPKARIVLVIPPLRRITLSSFAFIFTCNQEFGHME